MNGRKFDATLVAIAKESFEANRTSRKRAFVSLTFEELLGYFADYGMTFTDISKIAAEKPVSKECIRRIYNDYFKDLFPRRETGRQRQKAHTRECLRTRKKAKAKK